MRFSLLSVACVTAILTALGCSDDPAPSSSSGSSGTSTAPENPAFKADVMPILQQNCALSACHASKEAPAGVNITSDAAVTYAAITANSQTFDKTKKLVVAGDPEGSLLMRKVDGTQAANEGKPMPPIEDENAPADEQLISKKKRDTIRNWIANGAKND